VKLKLKGRTKNNTKKIWKRAIRATIKTKKNNNKGKKTNQHRRQRPNAKERKK
jgi:hypothetical protein